MTGGMGFEQEPARRAAREWSQLDQLMTKASQELASATTSGLAPECRGAARRFLSAWSGYAEESATLARGFSDDVEETITDNVITDQGARSDFSSLDGRLGMPR